MPTAQYDSNGNLVTPPGASGTPDQQVSDSSGNIINPSLEDGHLASIDTKLSVGTQKTQIVDGSGNVIGSTANALDINVKSGISFILDHSTSNILVYGNDGTTDRKLKTNSGGELQVDIVSGTVTATISNFPATQPVSGTVTTNAGTGTFTVGQATGSNLHAVIDSGSITVTQATGTNLHMVVDSGTVTANIGTTNGLALDATVAALEVSQGSSTSGQKGILELGAVTTAAPSYVNGQSSPISLTPTGSLRVDGSGVVQPVSGTVTANAGTGTFTVGQATGSNLHTVVDSGSISISNFPATQAVTQSGSWTVSLATESIEIGKVDQGTPGTLANAWPVELSDGTNLLGVTAHPVRTDPTGTTTQPVSGTITANAGTGNFTVVQATGTNLHMVVDSGTITIGNASIPVTQSGTWNLTNISGTISLPTGASTSALQTTGNSSLSSIDGKTPALGQALAAASVPVVLTAAQLTTLTPLSTIAATQSGSWTVSLATESIEIGKVDQGTAGTLANAWPVELSDGTNLLGVSAHPVRTDPTGTTTQPVSGTITANAGTGNFTVVQATGTNLHMVVDSGTITVGNATLAVTQSGTWNLTNISGTISLPTGAATAAKQPALGTAGTASADVITIQGIAGMTAVKVDGSGVTQPVSGTVTANIGTTNGLALDTSVNGIIVAQSSTTSGEKGPLVQGAVTTAAPAYSTGQTNPLSLDTSGRLRTDNSSWLGSTAPTVGAKTSANSIPVVIASDQAHFPVEIQDGAGTALTSTAVSTKQGLDVNIVDSADGNAAHANQVFTTSFEVNLPTGGTETVAAFLKNPNASGKTLIIKRIQCNTITTGNNSAAIRIYSDPTTSANGTAQTATTTSIGSGATAVATPFSSPTASANGAKLWAFSIASGTNGVYNPPMDINGLIRIAANHTLLLTGNPSANNINVSFTIVWQEV